MSVQGSPEWLAERAGHCTASCFKHVLAKIKSGEAATRRNYRMQLVTERITKLPTEGYVNAAMEWGTKTEPEARAALEAEYGLFVEQVGFVRHPKIKWLGASPDGLIESLPEKFSDLKGPGGVELKSPANSLVHVETMLNDAIPSEHMAQIQGCMWVTGRRWWIYASFDPRMPDNLKLFSKAVKIDDNYVSNLALEVKLFLAETQELYEQLLNLKG